MSAMKIIRRATVAVGLSAVLLAPLAPAQAVSGPDPEPRPTSSPSYSPKDAGKNAWEDHCKYPQAASHLKLILAVVTIPPLFTCFIC